MSEITAGSVFEVVYPFVRETYSKFDGEDYIEAPTWKPGCRYEEYQSGYQELDTKAVADGMGKQILTVVDVHKPGEYPTRVFYTTTWISPDGKAFGKGKLKMTTVSAFKRRTEGFMSHEYDFSFEMSSPEEVAA